MALEIKDILMRPTPFADYYKTINKPFAIHKKIKNKMEHLCYIVICFILITRNLLNLLGFFLL